MSLSRGRCPGGPHGGDATGSGYWITSSAVANNVSGMVRPSDLAVLRLMAISYFTDAINISGGQAN